MKRDKLQGVYEFVTVIEEGSFSAAAVSMGTTRSRVSQIISDLERRMSVQLISRSTRSMHLTEAGKLFYEKSKRGLDLIDLALDQLEQDQQHISGKIRLNSVGGFFGEEVLAPLVLQFMEFYPSVSVELDFSSAQVNLIADHYDLAIRMGELPDSNLIARPLTQYEVYTCASPAYLNAYGKLQHPRQLSQHKVIVGSVNKWRFYDTDAEDKIFDISVEGALFCPNGYVSRRAARQGLGIVRLPAFYLRDDLMQGTLLPVLPAWSSGNCKVSIVYPKARFRVKRVQALVNFLLDKSQDPRN